MSVTQFNFPTRILFGAGARGKITTVLKEEERLSRPLYLTDEGVGKLPFFSSLVEDAKNAGLTPGIFTGVTPNPVASQVMKGVEAYRQHNADSLVIVGGGAALDVGKAVALMINHPGTLFDYEDGKPDALPVDQPIPFVVAVPTTAGTGSEVGRSSVISDDTTHVKKIIFSPRMLPPVVISDPELTVGLPANITASTGIDVLSHCVEAFVAKGFHPLCDGIALEGIRLVADSLAQCVREPNNINARGNMLIAASMGATAFQKGLGVVHSCAHALSAVCDTPHGVANALMIVPCMRFNAEIVPERFSRMAITVGAGETSDDFIRWTEQLLADLNLPTRLSETGVSQEQIPEIVDIALQDVCHPSNPRPVTKDDFNTLIRDAF